MTLKYVCIAIIFIVSITTFGFAQTISENSMTLLAVSEREDGTTVGSTANLKLEVISGQGRVFIDTFPLTQVDTQISTRIAKEIACDFTDVSCDQYDFIYTITSGSSIIGGPSAGAAISALTVLTLDGERINKNVAITGTSNTGGLIGPVGGLREKIDASSRDGISTVLIPKGGRYSPFNASIQNETISEDQIDLVTYGLEKGISVIEVGNLYEVLNIMSNKDYDLIYQEVSIPSFYSQTMQSLANQLCTRTQDTINSINLTDFPVMINQQNTSINIRGLHIQSLDEQSRSVFLQDSSFNISSFIQTIQDLDNRSQLAKDISDYYSTASFCYNAGIHARFLTSLQQEISVLETQASNAIRRSEELGIDSYTTITELQTYMLVEERITEAKEHFKAAQEHVENNQTHEAIFAYSQAIERAFSAESWSAFYQSIGKKFQFNPSVLSESCSLKIREAEDRRNYVQYYAPFLSESPILDNAKKYQRRGQYELCLFEASKAKARFDVILGSIGATTDDDLDILVDERKILAEQAILHQTQKDIFPIIGYSYYEYALSLADTDKQSALLYLQYALELSNLDMYFPKDSQEDFVYQSVSRLTPKMIFFIGLSAGLLIAVVLLRIESRFLKKPARARKPKSSHPDRKKR